jgi:hypothetical protein
MIYLIETHFHKQFVARDNTFYKREQSSNILRKSLLTAMDKFDYKFKPIARMMYNQQ